jgi:hypothetical protein
MHFKMFGHDIRINYFRSNASHFLAIAQISSYCLQLSIQDIILQDNGRLKAPSQAWMIFFRIQECLLMEFRLVTEFLSLCPGIDVTELM